jgi:small-conductance mechanosensitive channel
MWDTIVRTYLNAILVGFGGFLLAFILSQILWRVLAKPMGEAWSKFLASLVGVGISIWTIKLILDSTGATGLIVVLVTAVTGALAFGSERVVSDLVAGVGLFLSRVFTVGDFVSLAGYEGKVVNISLLTTTLESVFGDSIYIRNSDATGGTVVNYSVKPGHLVAVKVSLPVTQDINVAVACIETAIQNFSDELSNTNYKPSILVETGEPGYFNIEVRAYVIERVDYGPEKTRLFLLVTNALKNAGLNLAF